MRDALTLLEQLISYSDNGPLTLARLRNILGLVMSQEIITFLNAFSARDAVRLQTALANILNGATTYETLFNSLLLALRDYLSMSISQEHSSPRLEILSNTDIIAIKLSQPDAFALMDILLETTKLLGESMLAQRVFELRVLEYLVNPVAASSRVWIREGQSEAVGQAEAGPTLLGDLPNLDQMRQTADRREGMKDPGRRVDPAASEAVINIEVEAAQETTGEGVETLTGAAEPSGSGQYPGRQHGRHRLRDEQQDTGSQEVL